MIVKFAEVAKQCIRLRNLYSLFAIVGALSFSKARCLLSQLIAGAKTQGRLGACPKESSKSPTTARDVHYESKSEHEKLPVRRRGPHLLTPSDVVRKMEEDDPHKPILVFLPIFLKVI